jgi:hypothetical protein
MTSIMQSFKFDLWVFDFIYVSSRINCVYRILFDINVRVPTQAAAEHALKGGPRCKPPRRFSIPPGPHLVHAQRGIERLAAEAIVVRREAGAGDQVAKGIVLVSIGHRRGGVGQVAYAAVGVVAVEARRPRAADELVLADALKSVGIRAGHRAAYQLVDHLRQPGGVLRINQIGGGHAGHGLSNAVAVAVIDDVDAAVLDQPVVEIPDVASRAAVQQIAVRVSRDHSWRCQRS